MKLPHLVNFLAIDRSDSSKMISIYSTVALIDEKISQKINVPLSGLFLLKKRTFQLELIAYDQNNKELFKKSVFTNDYGEMEIKIPNHYSENLVARIDITLDGRILKTSNPIKLPIPKKIIISDFDKTLVDTKYSNPKEILTTLKNPISIYPNIEESISRFRHYIENGHTPFIVSSSPHFFESSIRDWLDANNFIGPSIFLKNYRKIISLRDGTLNPKDINTHGFYKLQHLINILLMTGIPRELVLMGDVFESDPTIYLILSLILMKKIDAHSTWNEVKYNPEFKLTSSQTSRFLNKFYQLNNEIKTPTYQTPNITILIRETKENKLNIKLDFIKKFQDMITTYK